MDIFQNILENWSTYEKIQEIILLLSIPIVSFTTIYLTTKNKNILVFSCIMFVISTLTSIVGIIFSSNVLDVQITEIFRIVPLLTYLLILSNLGVLVGYYIHRKNRKDFDIVQIRREYLHDSIKQTAFLILLGSSIFMFVSVQIQVILLICILSCLIGIWSTYWLSRYILK